MTTNQFWRLTAFGALVGWMTFAAAAAESSVARSKADRVNVRSRPGYAGEVITQLNRGQEVRVLDRVTLSRPGPEEPADWLKIELPAEAPVWISSEYVEATTKAVKADVLNVRAGPSFDHAVVARLDHGTVVEPTGKSQDGWMQIIAPAGSVGYAPASWMTEGGEPEPSMPVASGGSPSVSATTAATAPTVFPATASSAESGSTRTVSPASVPGSAAVPATARGDYSWFEQFITPSTSGAPPVMPSPATPMPVETTPEAVPSSVPADMDDTTSATLADPLPEAAAVERGEVPTEMVDDVDAALPPPPDALGETEARQVRREGLVVRPINFQAPSFYALQAAGSRKIINFLYTTRAQPINWRDYRGKVVMVSGREYLDERYYWRGVPLLNVDEIEMVR